MTGPLDHESNALWSSSMILVDGERTGGNFGLIRDVVPASTIVIGGRLDETDR